MVRSCTSHPGVLGSIPKREEPLPLPPASSNSQDQQPNRPNPTPTQRRLTQQLSAHWPQFKALNWEHLRQRYAGTRFGEQRSASSTCLNPWLGAIRPTSANDAFDPALWETFVSTTLGLEVPVLSSLPRLNNRPLAKCGCKNRPSLPHAGHTVRTGADHA